MRLGLLLCLAGSASAVDMEVADMRSNGGVLPAEVSEEHQTIVTPISGGASSTTTGSRVDHMLSLREGIEGTRGRLGPLGGFLWGGGFSVSHYYFTSTPGSVRIVNPVAEVLVGYGYAPQDWLHFEVCAFGGGGYSLYSVQTALGEASSRSRYVEYGLRLGIYATFAESWQAGFEIPSLVGHGRPKYFQFDPAGNETVTSQTNIFRATGALISLGIHF